MNTYYCLDDSPRFEMIELNEIDSTNNFLKSYRPLQPKEVTLVTAEFQTAGRGQIGNSWESESGENLLFSLLIHPQNIKASQQFLISQISALSAKEALEAFTDGLSVKWPNDIYWHDKKIGGMLIENDLSGHTITNCIIGIGLNINQEKFHSPAPSVRLSRKGVLSPFKRSRLQQYEGDDSLRRVPLPYRRRRRGDCNGRGNAPSGRKVHRRDDKVWGIKALSA